MSEEKSASEAGQSFGSGSKKKNGKTDNLCFFYITYPHAKQSKKLNRRRAIRARCYDCSGYDKTEIRECAITDCLLYQFRMATGRQDPKARDRAIRDYCLLCMNNQRKEVSLCPSNNCPLYSYRQTPAAMLKKRHIGETLRDKILAEGVR